MPPVPAIVRRGLRYSVRTLPSANTTLQPSPL